MGVIVSNPEKGIQCSILHELSDNHDWPTLCHNPFQADNIRMIKLAHDAGLTQEVSSLALCVACLQSLDGHNDLTPSRELQTATTHLSKLSYIGIVQTRKRQKGWSGERRGESGGVWERKGEGQLLVRIKEPGGSRGRQQKKPGLKVMLLECIQGAREGVG